MRQVSAKVVLTIKRDLIPVVSFSSLKLIFRKVLLNLRLKMLQKNELISLYIDFSADPMLSNISFLLQGEERNNLCGHPTTLALKDY